MTTIVSQVDKYLAQRALQSDRDYTVFHPSEWSSCHRRLAYLYYEARGLVKVRPKKPSAQLQRIFDNGHSAHERWRRYLKDMGVLWGRWRCSSCGRLHGEDAKFGVLSPDKCSCGSSNLSYEELGFRDDETLWAGHVDALVDLSALSGGSEDEPKLIVVDIKTIRPTCFSGPSFSNLEEPIPSHKLQMQIYLYLTGLAEGKFIYECKASQRVKEFTVLRDDTLIEKEKRRAIRLREIVTQKPYRLPPRPHPSPSHRECVDCKFKSLCWDPRHGKRSE